MEEMPQNNEQEDNQEKRNLSVEEVEEILKNAEEAVKQVAPGIEEKRLIIQEKKDIITRLARTCEDIADQNIEENRLALEENDVPKARTHSDAAGAYLNLTQKCFEVGSLLAVEEAKYSDFLLNLNKQMNEVVCAIIYGLPKIIQYHREGIGEIEDVREILSNLKVCSDSYEKMPPEIQNVYSPEIAKVTFLINQVEQLIQDMAGVRYKEGKGLIIDEEIKSGGV